MARGILESPPSGSQEVLLGIPMPRPLAFSPALATPAQAESVYAEILQRFQAYSRSLTIPLATPSIIAAALWTDDRLRWILARLQSGSASPAEFALAQELSAAALEIFAIFDRWLRIDGGDPNHLVALQLTLGNLQSGLESASNPQSSPLETKKPMATAASGGGSWGFLALLGLLALVVFKRKSS